jgi:hypothetical protein
MEPHGKKADSAVLNDIKEISAGNRSDSEETVPKI